MSRSDLSIEDRFLRTLTDDVKLLSLSQSEKLFSFEGLSVGEGKGVIDYLEEQGLIQTREMLSRPELELVEPVCHWDPKSPEDKPDLGKASYRMKSRWRVLPVPTEFVLATKKGAKRFGGYSVVKGIRASEVTHDHHVGAVYLHYQKVLNGESSGGVEQLEWVGEGRLKFEGAGNAFFLGRVPDGVLRDIRGGAEASPSLVIDFGGSYSTDKLTLMDEAYRSCPYAFW